MLNTLPSLQRKLDAVDEAQRALHDCPGDRQEIHKALAKVPQFVVVGMQSAGKSSVLSRLSGLVLPTDPDRCTKVPIMLKLRRIAGDGRYVMVMLRGVTADNTPYSSNPEELAAGEEEAKIRDLQCEAQRLSGVSVEDFVEKFTVELEVRGPDVPNVTLIDLPGVVAYDPKRPNDAATAKRIVSHFVDMSGSLILAVVPLDADFANVLGKEIIHPCKEKVLFVGTKVDKLITDEKEAEADVARRLGTVSEYADNKSRFLVLGKSPDVESERQAFSTFSQRLIADFELGLPALAEEIQARTEKHLKQQIPEAIEVISVQATNVQVALDKIKKSTPLGDLVLTLKHIKSTFDVGSKARQDFFRDTRQKMAIQLKNLKLRPVICSDKYLRIIDAEEDLFVGSDVFVSLEGHEHLQPGKIVQVLAKKCVVEIGEDKEQHDIPSAVIYSTENSPKSMIADIKELCVEIQGLRSLCLVDPQPILERYSQDWAMRYRSILKSFVDETLTRIHEWLDNTFSLDNVPKESTKEAVTALHDDMKKRMDLIKHDAERAIARIVSYQESPLVFTTNDHYYQSCYRAFLEEAKTALTDDGDACEKLCQVRAYLKTQGKVILETAAKDLIGILSRDVEAAFEATIDVVNAGKWAEIVIEPRHVERKRETLSITIAALRKAEVALKGAI